MITIVNYGLGNIGSIENMLKKIGVKSFLIQQNSILFHFVTFVTCIYVVYIVILHKNNHLVRLISRFL